MDILDKLINNKPPKRALLLYLVIVSFSLICGWFISGYLADMVVSEQIKSMIALRSDSAVFTKLPDSEDIAAGEEYYSQFGISRSMDPRLMENRNSIRFLFFCSISGTAVIAATIWLIFALSSFFGIYGRLEKIRRHCVKISELAEEAITNEDVFGCIGRVYDGVELLSQRLNHLNSRLTAEKNFLSDFLTDFSHQLKTSIAIIRLNSEIISETDNLDDNIKKQLFEEITFNINAMETLTIASLKLAKLNADAVEYSFEDNDLKKTCENAIKRIHPLLRCSNIDITFECSAEKLIMRHDRVWLSEAVENIIKNSADHSECTDIRVTLKKQPMKITLSIADNGKGIPQEDVPKMFERFGKKSRSNAMTSVGIGLSIAQKIIQAHGGEIIVYSETDEGTRFDMIFL